ncbi:recombinase family protein [Patescibacteria group bacterium]|nr:recombinase family protein [Patescibacteria group bacterium]
METSHGKRVILIPHPDESKWIIRMFKLRIQGTLNDKEIVKQLNKLGYKSRKRYKRDPNDKTKVIGERGGKPLTLKQFWRRVENPVYAGINAEKWTEEQPVRGKFKGLVSIDQFNQANRGKVAIAEEDDQILIHRDKPADYRLNKQVRNPKYPFKRYVHCPKCNKPLYGSASRGKLGKYYPAYHCNKRGHYFRVPSKDFNETIESFVRGLQITPEYVEELKEYVLDLWNKRQEETQQDNTQVDNKISELRTQAKAVVEKIKFLNSEIAIKYMEEDLVRTEAEMKRLEKGKQQQDESVDMEIVMDNIGYFLEHLEELVLGSKKPLKRAEYFGLVFDDTPTYEDLVSGTPELAPFIALKDQFAGALVPKGDPTGSRTRITTLRG